MLRGWGVPPSRLGSGSRSSATLRMLLLRLCGECAARAERRPLRWKFVGDTKTTSEHARLDWRTCSIGARARLALCTRVDLWWRALVFVLKVFFSPIGCGCAALKTAAPTLIQSKTLCPTFFLVQLAPQKCASASCALEDCTSTRTHAGMVACIFPLRVCAKFNSGQSFKSRPREAAAPAPALASFQPPLTSHPSLHLPEGCRWAPPPAPAPAPPPPRPPRR
eukprot:SAG11_NODE_2482_length_3305_cov_1.521210_3_plen_222_part_00